MFPPNMSLSVRDAEQHEKVEKYVKTFSSWIPYEHRVLGEVKDVNGTARVVPIPPNIGEKRRVRDVNGTARVIPIPPNIVVGGQGRQ
jgi:hypothetical protein